MAIYMKKRGILFSRTDGGNCDARQGIDFPVTGKACSAMKPVTNEGIPRPSAVRPRAIPILTRVAAAVETGLR
jgi:hypothetical protein